MSIAACGVIVGMSVWEIRRQEKKGEEMADRDLTGRKLLLWLLLFNIGMILLIIGIAIIWHLRFYMQGIISCILAVTLVIGALLMLTRVTSVSGKKGGRDGANDAAD